uniref:CSON004351 protein n=1 Tax=Culicoides sonorensis TaxID=179676 RepID=A0A336LTK1_CULSO
MRKRQILLPAYTKMHLGFILVLVLNLNLVLGQTTCNNGQGRVLYERLPNQQLQGFDDDVVRDTAPPFRVLEKCQDLCLRDKTSSNLIRACASFDFQPGSRIASFSGSAEYEESTCYLTREQAAPEGIGNLMLVPNSVHFTEICLTSNRPERECPSRRYVYERHPRKKLKLPSSDIKEMTAANRSDCEDKCLNEFSFVCRSASYDSTMHSCFLSRFTRRTHPEMLEDDPNSDYLENTCLNAERRCDGLVVFVKEENKRLGGPFEVDIFNNMTLEECQSMCMRAEKYYCRSVEYDDQTKQCILSEEDSVSQKDDISISSSPTHHFYDLVCLDNQRGADYPDNSVTSHLFSNGRRPDTAFQRYRNSRLGGEFHSEITGRSLSECLDECLRQTSFQCRSAVYSDRFRTCRLSRYNQKDGMRIIYDADYDYYENLMPNLVGSDNEGSSGRPEPTDWSPPGDRDRFQGGNRGPYPSSLPGSGGYQGPGNDRYPTSNPGQWDPQMNPYPSGMPGMPQSMYPTGPHTMQSYPGRPDMAQGYPADPYYGGGGAGAYPDNRYNPIYDNRLPDDRTYLDRRPPPVAAPYPYDKPQPNIPQMYPDQRYPPSRGYPANKYPERGGGYPQSQPWYNMPPAYPSGQGNYPTAPQARPQVAPMQGGYDRYPTPDRRYPMGPDRYEPEYERGGYGPYLGIGIFPGMPPSRGGYAAAPRPVPYYPEMMRPVAIPPGFNPSGYDNAGPGDSFGGYGPPKPYSSRCDDSDVFKQMATRHRMRKQYIRRAVNVPSLTHCQRECIEARDFVCKSFNFKDTAYGADTSNNNNVGETTNCELSDRDSKELDIQSPLQFDQANYDFYERSAGRAGIDGECLDVAQVCNEDGMEFTLRTPEGFYGRIYTYGYYDRCFFRGNGGTINVLRISGQGGYPECGSQRYGDTMTNIVVVQFSDNVQTGRDKRFNLTCLFRGPGESVVTSGYIGAGSGSPIPIEYLPAENSMSNKVRLMILYQGRPTTTIAVGDPLTFRLEPTDGYGHADLFATNVVARDPYSGRSVMLIDRYGCPVDAFVFPELGRSRDGDSLEARFNAFKIPESNFLVFEATVRSCRDGCQPAYCPGPSGRSEPSFGRRRRSINETFTFENEDFNENSTTIQGQVMERRIDNDIDEDEDVEELIPEQVREMIEVFESREEMQQDTVARKVIAPQETVCLAPSEYHGLISAVILLMILLLSISLLGGLVYRRYWRVFSKNYHLDRTSPTNFNPTPFHNSNISTSTHQFNASRSSNLGNISNGRSSGLSLFNSGLQKTFATGNLARMCQIPIMNPIIKTQNDSLEFEDPSEPIYTDPSLFERSRYDLYSLLEVSMNKQTNSQKRYGGNTEN